MHKLALIAIVRDEAEWITPCLVSAIELGIDYWVIADTGSSNLVLAGVADVSVGNAVTCVFNCTRF